jgi:hypothetical protein
MAKFQGLLLIISSAVSLFAFIECAMRDETLIKKFPKWAWLLIIFFFGLFGSIFYLAAGRNGKNSGGGGFGKKPKPRQLPPDDNPDFLRGL